MTKELLQEVLDFTSGNTWIKELETKDDEYEYLCNYGNWSKINKYQLAFMCKEYALRNGYIIDSQIRGYCRGKGLCFIYTDDWTSEFPEYCLESFTEDSEVEAIFSASKWVMIRLKENK